MKYELQIVPLGQISNLSNWLQGLLLLTRSFLGEEAGEVDRVAVVPNARIMTTLAGISKSNWIQEHHKGQPNQLKTRYPRVFGFLGGKVDGRSC